MELYNFLVVLCAYLTEQETDGLIETVSWGLDEAEKKIEEM